MIDNKIFSFMIQSAATGEGLKVVGGEGIITAGNEVWNRDLYIYGIADLINKGYITLEYHNSQDKYYLRQMAFLEKVQGLVKEDYHEN